MYISGKNVAQEILSKNVKINKCYLLDSFADTNIVNELQKRNIVIKTLNKMEFSRFEIKNHQGIILSVDDYEYCSVDDIISNGDGPIIILDHLEDPHNLGAIIRTCEAFNVRGIIIPKNRSVSVTETVVKVSTGTVYNVKIAMVTNLASTIKALKKQNFWIYGTSMDGDDIGTTDFADNSCIVIGNEGTGIARLVRENCDFIVKIPMFGSVNSLNASVATGIIIYETTKKRR